MGNEQEVQQMPAVTSLNPLDSNLASKSVSDIETMIRQEESKLKTETPKAPEAQQEVVELKGTESGVQAQTPAMEQPKAEVPQPVTPAVPETPSKVTEFLEKKHLSKDDVPKLVDMYSSLEKEFSRKSQELAQLKRQPEAAPTQALEMASQLPAPVQEQFLADLQRDPIGTVQKLVQITQGPVISNLESVVKSQQLHNTVVALSTNPETAEFNLPIVQDEIKKILTENPSYQNDMAKSLPIANDMAIGRLYRQGKLNKDAVATGMKMAEQARTSQAGAVMESAGKPPAPPSPKTPEQMTVAEMEAMMKNAKW